MNNDIIFFMNYNIMYLINYNIIYFMNMNMNFSIMYFMNMNFNIMYFMNYYYIMYFMDHNMYHVLNWNKRIQIKNWFKNPIETNFSLRSSFCLKNLKGISSLSIVVVFFSLDLLIFMSLNFLGGIIWIHLRSFASEKLI